MDLVKHGIPVSNDEMVYQCHSDHYSVVDDIVDEYDGNYDTRYGADSNVNESSSADSPQHVELQPVHTDTQSVHRTDDRVLPSAGGHRVPSVVNPDNPRAMSVASERSTKSASSVVSDKSSQRNTSDSDSVLMQSMNKLIKAQSDMLTVQTQAVAIQGLPPLKKFSGDVIDSEEDSFEKWLELLEERAHLAGWTEQHKLYQLKVHLESNALQFFRMLPKETQKAVSQLKKRFSPVNIEELRGIEFHQIMQGTETIEQLGITLQKLGRKAFPGVTGKEFDRLLKGRFFQALHQKWQRKLGAPKPGDTFQDLYDRARILEKHHHQISNTASNREKRVAPLTERKPKRLPEPSVSEGSSRPLIRTQSGGSVKPKFDVVCRECKAVGHYARDCPQRGRGKQESSGKSTSKSAALTASAPASTPTLDSFSVQQLEHHIAQRKLAEETSQLQNASKPMLVLCCLPMKSVT